MNNKLFYTQLGVVCALVVCVYLIYQTNARSQSIAYVRSYELIEKYLGTIEARAEFEKKKQTMLANTDSLRVDYERSRIQYLKQAARLPGSEREERERLLEAQERRLMRYKEAIELQIQEEDNKLMQEIFNQINSYIEEFATKRGYEIVLGTTTSGSLLYAQKHLDITDEVILELNERYAGKR